MNTGPLANVSVLQLGGIGPVPAATMLMADLGAEVIQIDRPDNEPIFTGDARQHLLNRNKKSIALDLKHPKAAQAVAQIAASVDIVVEGFRPGVAERLGVGPADLRAINEKLVYCRLTGWGQTGPLADQAGHDINYIAVTGALHMIGDAGGPPQIPTNLIGDFSGGSAYMVIGALAALYEAQRSGRGQVIDSAIVDGTVHLMTCIQGMLNTGAWRDERGVNLLDGGAPYYHVYETSDGKYMSVGAIEPKFYRNLLHVLGVDIDPADQDNERTWPATAAVFAETFKSRTRDEWTTLFDKRNACVSAVASMTEAADEPQLVARQSYVVHDGVVQSAPAPRFSRTPGQLRTPPPLPGEHTSEVLTAFGVDAEALFAAGAASNYAGPPAPHRPHPDPARVSGR